MNTDLTSKPHFADYARPLWSRKWLIIIAVVIATGGVYAYYNHQPKVFSSETLVYVKDPGDPVSGIPSLASTDRSVQNQAALLYSHDVADRVARSVHYRGTPGELLEHISVDGVEGQDFVKISADEGTPREAADIANAYASEFVTLVSTSQRSRIQRALQLSRNQLSQVAKGPATQGTRQTLGEQIRRLELALKVPPETTRQIDTAPVPPSASSPKPVRNALFAFVLSLILAVGVAFGLERFDRRLKRPEEVEPAYGLPLLAVLPHTGQPAPMTHDAATLSPEFREAFRVLRTNIELARLDAPPRTIVVTSAVPGEGKSTVVRNLALAFRETGKRVAVVEGDLRHAALARLFGVRPGPGLTEVLTANRTLTDVTLPVATALPGFSELVPLSTGAGQPGANGHANGNGHDEVPGAVTLLLAGARPANPPAVLAAERVAQVLDELGDHHDIVLIDSAPLLAVTDTVPLLRYADAAVLVGRLGYTTRDTAKRLADFLGRIPDAGPLGVVANDLSHFEAMGFGYGYGYGGYGYGSDESPKRGAKPQQAVKA